MQDGAVVVPTVNDWATDGVNDWVGMPVVFEVGGWAGHVRQSHWVHGIPHSGERTVFINASILGITRTSKAVPRTTFETSGGEEAEEGTVYHTSSGANAVGFPSWLAKYESLPCIQRKRYAGFSRAYDFNNRSCFHPSLKIIRLTNSPRSFARLVIGVAVNTNKRIR